MGNLERNLGPAPFNGDVPLIESPEDRERVRAFIDPMLATLAKLAAADHRPRLPWAADVLLCMRLRLVGRLPETEKPSVTSEGMDDAEQ